MFISEYMDLDARLDAYAEAHRTDSEKMLAHAAKMGAMTGPGWSRESLVRCAFDLHNGGEWSNRRSEPYIEAFLAAYDEKHGVQS